jgi:CheY-like chemotaxis protein
VLSVQDNGCGIPREEWPRIFEPFFTTKFQGRGLGLSVVSGIIEKFDGSIGVRSKVNVGTEMLLCLPVAEAAVLVEDAPEPVAESTAKDPEGFALSERKKIWVVDDEPLICETVMRILTQNGYDVSTEQNSKAFLENFSEEEAEQTDCLLLDLTMPEVSGLDILKSVRVRHPDLPVMIMSGYDEQDQKDELEKHRISGFVHKPFQMRDLLEAIDKVFA